MRLLRQQLDLPPIKELMQGSEGVLCDGALVYITPHLQAHQSHTNIQSPIELIVERRRKEGKGEGNMWFQVNDLPFSPKFSSTIFSPL